MRGPFSFSTNEECGALVSAFDSSPMVMTPYQPPFYHKRLEECGLDKAEDLICYFMRRSDFTDRIARAADISRRRFERSGDTLEIRTMRREDWDAELASIKTIYNKAWEQNWGFIPMTESEMNFVAKELKPIADMELILFAEVNGVAAGFSLALPDYNVILRHLNGEMFSPRTLVLFPLLRRSIHQIRLMMMGILPEYRRRGIEFLIYERVSEQMQKCGHEGIEMSWILERNTAMRHQIEAVGGYEYRRYRLYTGAL